MGRFLRGLAVSLVLPTVLTAAGACSSGSDFAPAGDIFGEPTEDGGSTSDLGSSDAGGPAGDAGAASGGPAGAVGGATGGDGAPGDGDPTGNDVGPFSLSLMWEAPVENADGTLLRDLAGYKVYDGPASHEYTMVTDVGNSTSVTIDSLPEGVRFVAVTAYDQSGNESSLSRELSVVLP